jgi:LPXTG-motif cell wall-anchored protein
MKATGITLIIIGLLLTIFTGFGFFTKKEVADLGKIEIKKEEPHRVNWSPWVGVGLIVIGGVILLTRKKGITD